MHYRWFNLQQSKEITQLAVLVIENVSVNDMEDNKNHFPHSLEIFSHGVEVMTNLEAEDLGLSNELAISPITAHIKAKISNGLYISTLHIVNKLKNIIL